MQAILQPGATTFGLSLTNVQIQQFEQYSHELVAWNQQVNLTGITAPADIAVKHFLDSLSVHAVLPSDARSLIDVGTGAGFPGMPLKIARPDLNVTLLDSLGKRTAFLTHLVERLALNAVTIVTARAEIAAHASDHRARYDVAVARAVAPLAVLTEYLLPFVSVAGVMIAQKGQLPAEELYTAKNALSILGGQVESVQPVQVPGLDAPRHLIVIRKQHETPVRYPRRAGVPVKKPL